jgi:hypothetical protein
MTALRYMTGRGRFNTLAAYVKMGGRAWVMGGGAGFASNIEWNDAGNDAGTITFCSIGTRPDLKPGRFMYDIGHWQSCFRSPRDRVIIQRYAGRYRDRADPDPDSYTRFINELPAEMQYRTLPEDSLPPFRRTGEYLLEVTPIEYMFGPNYIIENISTNPQHPDEQSTLDTLYQAYGGTLPFPDENPSNACMTYYHGRSAPQGFIFTGFNVWDFKRSDCQAVVDFVLHRMWGRNRDISAASLATRESARTRPVGAIRAGSRTGPVQSLGRPGAIRNPARLRLGPQRTPPPTAPRN